MRILFSILALLVLVAAPQLTHANKDLDITAVRGVSLPSFEWACVQYGQVYDFPLTETLELLQRWNFDTIRLPLNQDCWLEDMDYRADVKEVVDTFGAAGINSIIDLHWNAPTGASSHEQQVMADAEKSPAFWRAMAETYKDNPYVIGYELYNEPRDISWDCWLKGCTAPEGWETVGMQDLVDVVRRADSDTWLIVNGLHWGNDVQGAIEHRPTDPAGKLSFGWHVYDEFEDPNKCTTPECFESEIAPLAEDFPIVVTEFGSRLLCNPDHDQGVMEFAQRHGLGLVGWAWYPADCGFPALIKDWSGTPTEAGWRLCTFMEGNCSAIVQQKTELPEGLVAGATDTRDPNQLPICYVSFKHGVLGHNGNVTCTGGYELEITGAADQTWNDRITSWQADDGWFAISGWDYYTTSGRVEKGHEIWLHDRVGQVVPEANDRTRYLFIRPNFTGSLTVYQDDNQTGASLTFTLK